MLKLYSKFQSILSAILLSIFLIACADKSESIKSNLPEIKDPKGEAVAQKRAQFCDPNLLSFSGEILSPENFQAAFNCANADGSLWGLNPIIQSSEFPTFLNAVNDISSSQFTGEIRDSLESWFEEDSEGVSKIDRVLKYIPIVVRNVVFKSSLPILASIANEGREVWKSLLPAIGKLIYNPEYPHFYSHLRLLWNVKKTLPEEFHASQTTREFARFMLKVHDNESNAHRLLRLLDDVKKIEIPGSNLYTMFDEAHIRGSFVTLYTEAGGAIRGEKIYEELNPGGIKEQRDTRKKLFEGKNPKILELIHLLDVFNKERPQFLPAVANWISANKELVNQEIFEFAGKQILGDVISNFGMNSFLKQYFKEDLNNKVPGSRCARKLNCRATADQFVTILDGAFKSERFGKWLTQKLILKSIEQFGEKKGELLSNSEFVKNIFSLYQQALIVPYADYIIKIQKPNQKKESVKKFFLRFSNKHLDSIKEVGLKIAVNGKEELIRDHLLDEWLSSAQKSWGDQVVTGFFYDLASKLFTEYADKFSVENPGVSLSQWIFYGANSSPSTVELIAYNLVTGTDLLEKLPEITKFLKEEVGQEMFNGNPDDQEAFNLLVDNIENLWLYVKSGMYRSGNNLKRALSENNKGFLSNNYTDLISSAHKNGLTSYMVPIWYDLLVFLDQREDRYKSAWERADRELYKGLSQEQIDRNRARRLSYGVDALKYLGHALFEPQGVMNHPEYEGDYDRAMIGQLINTLKPLVSKSQRADTEKFILDIARSATDPKTTDQDIEDFYQFFSNKKENYSRLADDRKTLKTISEMLQHKSMPDALRSLDQFFKDKSVEPALDYLAEKSEDGTIADMLIFVRKVMGMQEKK